MSSFNPSRLQFCHSRLAENLVFISWIPAFAGMTVFVLA